MFIARFWLPAVASLALLVPASGQTPESPMLRWKVSLEDADSRNASLSSALPENAASPESRADHLSQPQDAHTVATPLVGTPIAAADQPSADRHATAEAQLRQQEKQRVVGVLPLFDVSYDPNPVSLTGGQKIRLALRTSLDPVTFATAFIAAGYHEVRNDQTGFPWGARGYFERTGTGYLDSFGSNMIGNGLLPAVLHQEPRYIRLGHGSYPRRLFYAASTAFVCKHDNTGKWEPNYSNIGGNILSGAISNFYYPGSDSGIGLTISTGMVVTTEGMIGTVLQEFWPDISRRFLHRDPTHGLDR